jgi:hypothetical protein
MASLRKTQLEVNMNGSQTEMQVTLICFKERAKVHCLIPVILVTKLFPKVLATRNKKTINQSDGRLVLNLRALNL